MHIFQQIVNAIPSPALITTLNLHFCTANKPARKIIEEFDFQTQNTNPIFKPVEPAQNWVELIKEKGNLERVKLINPVNNKTIYAAAGLINLYEPFVLWTIEPNLFETENPGNIRQLIEAIPNPVFYKNRQGVYTGCNKAFLKFLNRSKDEIIGKTVFDIADRDIAQKYKEKDDELFENQQTQVYEWFIQPAGEDLKNVVFHKDITVDENGEVTGLIGVIQDITDFKKVEQALVESEDRFRTYVENAIDIFFTLDTNGTFTYVSPNWQPVLGHKSENVIGRSFAEFVYPEDIPAGYEYIKKILKQGKVKESLEYRARHIDGSYRWQSSRGSLVRIGNTVTILGVAHDIEDLKRAEAEIIHSETTYRGIIDQLSEAVYILDENGLFSDVNRSALNFYGYDSSDFKGRTPDFLSAPGMNDMNKVHANFESAFKGHPVTFEFWGLKKDGTIFPKEIHMSAGTYFGKKCVIALAFDITERKKREQELKRLIDFQKTLVDLSIMFINIDLKLLHSAINYAIEETGKFLGADRAYIFNYDHTNKTASNTYEWCAHGISPTIKKNQNIPFDVIREQLDKHQNDEIFFLQKVESMPESAFKNILLGEEIQSLITLPLFVNHQCIGFLGFDSVRTTRTWDQSELSLIRILVQLIVNTELRKMHEKTMVDARDTAQRSNRAKSDFLANISHEIRTPLNSVIGFTDLLLKSIQEGKQHTYLQIVRGSAYALYDLINDVLDFSKIEAGKLEIVPEKVEFEQFIELVVSTTAPEIHKKELEFILSIEGNVPKHVILDSLRIRQILNNLLSNATKFTEKGEIELSVVCKKAAEPFMEITFEVRDTGIGISNEYIDKIFELFSQADSTTTRKYGGTGLGLAITNRLLQQMGSRVQVESIEGHGSRFFFTLTVEFDEIQKHLCSQLVQAKKALIIDSNERSRKVLANMLSMAKMETAQTESLVYQETNQVPDILFLDLGEESQSNLDALKLFKEKVTKPKPFIVGIYKPVFHDIYESARKTGLFDAFVEKPLAPFKLCRIMPKMEDALKKDIGDEPLEEKTIKPLTILIVEDNKASMMLSATIIARICPACIIDKAYDGKEALTLVEQKKYGLILLDIQLPDIDGFEIAQRIREQRKSLNYSSPIVALTAGVFQNEKERCIKLGMNDFIAKPVKEHALRAAIEKYASFD